MPSSNVSSCCADAPATPFFLWPATAGLCGAPVCAGVAIDDGSSIGCGGTEDAIVDAAACALRRFQISTATSAPAAISPIVSGFMPKIFPSPGLSSSSSSLRLRFAMSPPRTRNGPTSR
jgi:hypothetical protein